MRIPTEEAFYLAGDEIEEARCTYKSWDWIYCCPLCGSGFSELKVAQGKSCCSVKCYRKYQRKAPEKWREDFEQFLCHGIPARRGRSVKGKYRHTQIEEGAVTAIMDLGRMAFEWVRGFSTEEQAVILERHPSLPNMCRPRIERLRMLREDDLPVCAKCGEADAFNWLCNKCGSGKRKLNK